MQKNIENFYNVLKTFMPVADKYLANSPLEQYIPQLKNIVTMIESIGGISTINNILNNFSKQNMQNNLVQKNNETIQENYKQNINNNLKKIDDYKKIN